MSKQPPGGPSTISGIHYQMLWSLLRASQMTVTGTIDEGALATKGATILLLEPIGGGGDAQEIGTTIRRVYQLKAKSGDGTWSLKKVVEEVLPDLFKAVDLSTPSSEYWLVTSGRQGRWANVQSKLFDVLRDISFTETSFARLDDREEIAFGRHDESDFWTKPKYTQRTLFETIAGHILNKLDKGVPDKELLHRVWHLLGRFKLWANCNEAEMKRKIDNILVQQISVLEQVGVTREAMLTGLAEKARHGDAKIVAKEFFAKYGLDSIRLSDRRKLGDMCRVVFHRQLGRLGYERALDVRAGSAAEKLGGWPAACPILVFAGESGQGKSWMLFAGGEHLIETGELVVLVEAVGDAAKDIDDAAARFWVEVKGSSQSLPMSGIANFMKTIGGASRWPWIIFLIDGVQDVDEARRLASYQWEDVGARIVLTCSSDTAKVIETKSQGRSCTIAISDFSPGELQDYLTRTIGSHWPSIPSDVRTTLSKPILASIYGRITQGAPWSPHNEYELYQAYWHKIGDGSSTEGTFCRYRFGKLALSILDSAPYPWSCGQFEEAELGEKDLALLIRAGWIRHSGRDTYEVAHDRLLNWAVASGLFEQLRRDKLSKDELCTKVVELLKRTEPYSGHFSGYVPLDLIYLLLENDPNGGATIRNLLIMIESDDYRVAESLYSGLLSTLGPQILPILSERIGEFSEKDQDMLLSKAIGAVGRLKSVDILEPTLILLASDSRKRTRAALRLLQHCATPRALDRAWEIHCEMMRNPAPFLGRNERDWELYDESFGALRECVKLAPQWLIDTIEKADATTTPIHDLAYLVANLNDGGATWLKCKGLLMSKVPVSRPRALATNISIYRDRAEIPWLLKHIDQETDLVGPTAFRGLARIDAQLAAKQIHRLPKRELVTTHAWWFGDLMAAVPDTVRREALALLRSSEDLWLAAEIYNGSENDMDNDTLQFLLDSLEPLLDANAASSTPKECHELFRPLGILSRISRVELIRGLEGRRGSALYEKLVAFLLRIGPQEGVWRDCHEREFAMALLQKVGGQGFTSVLNAYLSQGRKPGRLEIIRICVQAADTETQRILVEIAQQDDLWDGHPIEQGYATKALAALGEGRAVVESMIRIGVDTLRGTDESFVAPRPLDDLAIQPAIEVLDGGGADNMPGAIMAIGFARRQDLASRILAEYSKVDPASKIAHACVMAIEDFEGLGVDATAIAMQQLSVPSHSFAAKRALFAINTPESRHALYQHLVSNFDVGIVVALVDQPDTAPRAIELLRTRLADLESTAAQETLRVLLAHHARPQVRDLLASITKLESYFRDASFLDESRFWITGTKINAIRGLSIFDVKAAILASTHALADLHSHEREQFPYLLMDLDAQLGVDILLAQALSENSRTVLWSIGRALIGQDLCTVLSAWLTGSDSRKQLVACCLARWQSTSPELTEAVKHCADHGGRKAADAAIETLKWWREQDVANQLLIEFLGEPSISRRWMLLDALLETADPGDQNMPLSPCMKEASVNLETYAKAYFFERLKKRRESMKRDLDRIKD